MKAINILFAALLLAGCGQQAKKSDAVVQDEQELTETEVQATENADPVEAITTIYNQLGYNSEETVNPKDFMTEGIKATLAQLRELEDRDGGPYIDVDPWIGAQDYDKVVIEDAELLESTESTASVKLILSLTETHKSTIFVAMKMEEGQWKVDDLRSDRISLKETAEKIIAENK